MTFRIVIGINKQNVEVALSKKNRTKKWFASQIGTVPEYVSQMLIGKRNPSPEMRDRITKIFHGRLTWDDIFTVRRKENDSVR